MKQLTRRRFLAGLGVTTMSMSFGKGDAATRGPMLTRPIGRAAEHVRQFLCGLHGHDALLHFEQGRISLQCNSCGYETPGWDVKGVPARAEAPEHDQAARELLDDEKHRQDQDRRHDHEDESRSRALSDCR